jgi:hypothetical protein
LSFHYTLDPFLAQLGGIGLAFAQLQSGIVEHMGSEFEHSLVELYPEHNKPAFVVLEHQNNENPEYNA